jgi:hypothetical protein
MSSRRWTRKLPFGNPPRPWRVDDEKVAYPMLQASRRLGVKNICLHKESKLKAAYREQGPRPSLTQYGWVLDRC